MEDIFDLVKVMIFELLCFCLMEMMKKSRDSMQVLYLYSWRLPGDFLGGIQTSRR